MRFWCKKYPTSASPGILSQMSTFFFPVSCYWTSNRGKSQCSSMQRVLQYPCLLFPHPLQFLYRPKGIPSKCSGPPWLVVGETCTQRVCACVCVYPITWCAGGYWHGNCVDSSQAPVPAGSCHAPSPFWVDLVEWLVGCSGHAEHSPIYKKV